MPGKTNYGLVEYAKTQLGKPYCQEKAVARVLQVGGHSL